MGSAHTVLLSRFALLPHFSLPKSALPAVSTASTLLTFHSDLKGDAHLRDALPTKGCRTHSGDLQAMSAHTVFGKKTLAIPFLNPELLEIIFIILRN